MFKSPTYLWVFQCSAIASFFLAAVTYYFTHVGGPSFLWIGIGTFSTLAALRAMPNTQTNKKTRTLYKSLLVIPLLLIVGFVIFYIIFAILLGLGFDDWEF
jgi:hypothetical protein